MKKLIMTKGLPASGKDTYAKQEMEKDSMLKRVNKDEIRILLDFGKWSRDNEKFVLKVRDNLIVQTLTDGYSVICTDTNLAPKHSERLKQLAEQNGAIFEIKDFTDVSVDECIKRDALRANSVGVSVIMGMYNQFLRKSLPTPVYNSKLPNAILCDLDGTLALFDGNPYDRDFGLDKVNIPVKYILLSSSSGNKSTSKMETIIVSGRNGKYEKVTKNWLKKNDIYYDKLFMRTEGDTRKDVVIKQEIYDNNIKGKYNVLFVIDDRKQVKRMWVNNGIFVLDVNQKDEEF